MTEQEVLKKIKESAEGVEIPVKLGPEEIRSMLNRKAVQTPSFCWQEEAADHKDASNGKKQRILKYTAAAAVLLLAVSVSGAGMFHLKQNGRPSADSGYALNQYQNTEIQDVIDRTDVKPAQTPKQDAGELYTVAKSYEDVYQSLEQERERYYDRDGMAGNAVAEEETGSVEFSSSAVKFMTDAASDESTLGYSKTNLQTEGVDESDFIKTNGAYIFTVSGGKIIITDVRSGNMESAGEIDPGLNTAADNVLEMYVDDGHLTLIVQRNDTYLQENQLYEVDIPNGGSKRSGMLPVEDCAYRIESKNSTVIYTYDISNPQAPRLTGKTEQDGFYRTSRKIGDIVYLFTEQGLFGAANRATDMERTEGCFLPLVNGEQISYDSIYLPKQGSEGLIVSSFDVNKPETAIDKTMIVNDYVNIYVSTDALYLYHNDYSAEQIKTQIAKFLLKDGVINASGATSVNGEILDTFAINEYCGKLRVLTTGREENGGTETNNLYLLNEALELTGSVTGIARGERIYAARYFGDTAYFITYRNTDPLFAVDLSDEKNPKLLGELKVTGFSEYLHPWGEDKLLGIGYETNPETGEQMGIKLIMFDISNPAELKEISSLVIQNAEYSPALYDYKCVTAEKNANIAAFAVYDYDAREAKASYLVFSWEGDHFENRLTTALGDWNRSEDYRGIYIGDRFYLANSEEIVSFDRTDGYRELQKLSLE